MTSDTEIHYLASGVLPKILDRGRIRVGITTFYPWAMPDRDGKWIGYNIDIATQLAEDMGVDLEFVPAAYEELNTALKNDRFDVMIAGTSTTTWRNLEVNITTPYIRHSVSIVTSRKLEGVIETTDDLNKPDIVVLRSGLEGANTAKRLYPRAQDTLIKDDAQCFQAVQDSTAHAFHSIAPKASLIMLQYPNLFYVPPAMHPIVIQQAGISVRKGDPDILNYLDNWLLQRRRDGWLEARWHNWSETTEWFDQVENNPYVLG